MNKYTQEKKLGNIIFDTNTSLKEKQEKIIKLFEDEEYLNMQYYMEYCQMNGYITPMDWIDKHKHF